MRTNNIYRWNQTTFHLSLIFFNAVSYIVSFDNHESGLRSILKNFEEMFQNLGIFQWALAKNYIV